MKLGLLIVPLPHGLRDFWITLYKESNNFSYGESVFEEILFTKVQKIYIKIIQFNSVLNFIVLTHS
jgi:hypothetical protein